MSDSDPAPARTVRSIIGCLLTLGVCGGTVHIYLEWFETNGLRRLLLRDLPRLELFGGTPFAWVRAVPLFELRYVLLGCLVIVLLCLVERISNIKGRKK